MWSPGVLTHDRTELHDCTSCPPSKQQVILNPRTLQRYHGNTPSCLFQFLPQQYNQITWLFVTSYLNRRTPAYSLLYSYIDTNISAAVGYLRRWFFPNVLFFGMEKQKRISACCLFLPKCNHLHVNSKTSSWNSLLAASEAAWCYALFCLRKKQKREQGAVRIFKINVKMI